MAVSILRAFQSSSEECLDLIATFCLRLPDTTLFGVIISNALSLLKMFETFRENKDWRSKHGESSYKLSKQGRRLLGLLLPKICSEIGKVSEGDAIILLERLLDIGADLDSYVFDDKKYNTNAKLRADGMGAVYVFSPALSCAASTGYTNAVEFLLDQGADVNHKSVDGSSAIHFASRYSGVETMTILLKGGASVEALDHGGNTPLHHAAIVANKHRWKNISFLIEHRSPVSIRNNDGFEAIHVLAANSPGKYGENAMKELLRAGASIDSTTNSGETALAIVLKNRDLERGSHDIILLLLRWGADPTSHMPHPDPWLQSVFEGTLAGQATARAEGKSYPLPLGALNVPIIERKKSESDAE